MVTKVEVSELGHLALEEKLFIAAIRCDLAIVTHAEKVHK